MGALVYAAAGADRSYGRSLFGPEAEELSSGDPDVDAYERRVFAAAIQRRHELRRNSDGTAEILVGEKTVPFPIPLAQCQGRWLFDTPAGLERLKDLRVGYYELRTLEALRAVFAAQREYQGVDRDNDGVKEFAPRFVSTQGTHDGLYWPTAANEPNSPLGAYFTQAQAPASESLGFNGYFFELLTAQGPGAPGGARSYLDSAGNMVGGFAVLAYPAIYDQTAVMTFLMGPDGVVYQRDLGPKDTATAAATIAVFDPADGWTVTHD